MNTEQDLKTILKEKEKTAENIKKEYDNPIRMGRDMKNRLLLIELEAEIYWIKQALSAIETREKEILDNLLKNVEEGKVGKIDYLWDGKKVVRDNIIFTREELKQQITNQSQQDCNGGQTISVNMGSQRNSLQGKVSATSENSAYGLQATSERGDYKTMSNMETIGDVRLKSSKVVSLLNDGTPRSSKSPADAPQGDKEETK